MNLHWVRHKVPCKHRIKHFILCEEKLVNAMESKMVKIFNGIWNNNVLNAIIIYWNQTLSAVSYTPFPSIQLQFIPKSDLLNRKIIFSDKSRNLQGHPFRVTAFYDVSRATFNRHKTNDLNALGGVDGLLGRLIIEKMNASLTMSEPKDAQQIGELFPNKTATGCLAALMNGQFDFGLNMRFYRLDHFEGKVEATRTNGRDDICFLVPRQGPASNLANIFGPFCSYTWIAIVVALPCYVLVYYSLNIQEKDKRSLEFHFFQFFGYMLQQPTVFLTQSKRQKILIVFWLMSTLLLSSMYQCKLSGPLIIPKDQPEINSIKELSQSNLKILSFARYNRQIIEFFSDPKYKGRYKPLFKLLKNCSISQFDEYIEKLDRSYGFANKHHINMHLRRVNTLGSTVFYHPIEQCPVPYLGVYGIRYGSPYKDIIDFIIHQAQETGLIEKWERINQLNDKKSQAKLHNGHGNVAFNLNHLQTAFYIYLIGCATAIGAFFSEIMYERFMKKKENILLNM